MKSRNYGAVLWWGIAAGIVSGCVVSFVRGLSGYDWVVFYYPQARGVGVTQFMNPMWACIPLLPIAQLPLPYSYGTFLTLNIVLFWIGTRLTGSKQYLLLLSFPAFWVLWFGQLDGLVLFGVALGIKALELGEREREGDGTGKSDREYGPILMGIAILLVLIKPHIGAPLAAFFLLRSPRRATLLTILGGVILSMAIWGWTWPLAWTRRLLTIKSGDFVQQTTNISLFPYGLLTWLALPAAKSPLDRVKVILSATLLSVPYAAAYSVLPLLVTALPWWAYLLTDFPFVLGSKGYHLVALAPLFVICQVVCARSGWRS